MQYRNRLRSINTLSKKRRILECLEDDTLIRFLIEICQDAMDPKVSSYEKEDEDVAETIREILIRMGLDGLLLRLGLWVLILR